MLFFALQASYEGLNYIFGPVSSFDSLFRDKYTANLLLVRTHAVASVVALCLGLFTFLRQTRRLKVHATFGRVYGISVLVGGLTALPMALMAEGGLWTRLAFFLQASFWIVTMLWAISSARNRRLSLHRRMMIRNYSITYSAVASRLLLHGLQNAGLDFQEIYPVLGWTWLLGLSAAEWWIWYSKSFGASKS